MDGKKLRKVASDLSIEMNNHATVMFETTMFAMEDGVEQVSCACCGLKEDCTKAYIAEVRSSHSGIWVCGLCSEAVKEKLQKAPLAAVKEAVSSHMEFCYDFIATTRQNPKLSLTFAMKDIAKRCWEHRNSMNRRMIARSSSCSPRVE